MKFRIVAAALCGITYALTVHGFWLQLGVWLASSAASLAILALYDGWLADD
jgi:hypothetical protein